MLNNLHEVAIAAQKNYKEKFQTNEIVLSDTFKETYSTYLRSISQDVRFSLHTATVTTSQNKKMYIPNQWFLAASYMVPYVGEIIKYKNAAEAVLSTMYGNSKDKKDYIGNMKNTEDKTAIASLQTIVRDYFNQSGFDNVDSDTELLTKFMSDYEWWFGSKTIDRGDYYVSPVLYLLGVVNVSQAYIADIAYILATVTELTTASEDMAEPEEVTLQNSDITTVVPVDLRTMRITGGINEIVYGAPGTGKSRYLEDKYGKSPLTRRVVFHSEYSYYDFIGVYKPVPVYKESDKNFTTVDGQSVESGEPYIDYKFVQGPFIKVLVEAWLDPENMHTLLIEEINRANAAFVFGEVFQLLDRDGDGYSEYTFEPSEDLYAYLCSIEGMEKYIRNGVGIPSNMNIVATMNSADQGVKPMDSAFKRRWNFKYVRIDIKGTICEKAELKYAGRTVYWGRLVELINKKLSSGVLKIDEDKLVGPFFIKPEEIGKKRAIDKLLLYLWDDVLRYSRDTFFNSDVQNFADLSEKFETEDVLDLIQSQEDIDYMTVDMVTTLDKAVGSDGDEVERDNSESEE